MVSEVRQFNGVESRHDFSGGTVTLGSASGQCSENGTTKKLSNALLSLP